MLPGAGKGRRRAGSRDKDGAAAAGAARDAAGAPRSPRGAAEAVTGESEPDLEPLSDVASPRPSGEVEAETEQPAPTVAAPEAAADAPAPEPAAAPDTAVDPVDASPAEPEARPDGAGGWDEGGPEAAFSTAPAGANPFGGAGPDSPVAPPLRMVTGPMFGGGQSGDGDGDDPFGERPVTPPAAKAAAAAAATSFVVKDANPFANAFGGGGAGGDDDGFFGSVGGPPTPPGARAAAAVAATPFEMNVTAALPFAAQPPEPPPLVYAAPSGPAAALVTPIAFDAVQDNGGADFFDTVGAPVAPSAPAPAPWQPQQPQQHQQHQPHQAAPSAGVDASVAGVGSVPATTMPPAVYAPVQPQSVQPPSYGYDATSARHPYPLSHHDDGTSFFDDVGAAQHGTQHTGSTAAPFQPGLDTAPPSVQPFAQNSYQQHIAQPQPQEQVEPTSFDGPGHPTDALPPAVPPPPVATPPHAPAVEAPKGDASDFFDNLSPHAGEEQAPAVPPQEEAPPSAVGTEVDPSTAGVVSAPLSEEGVEPEQPATAPAEPPVVMAEPAPAEPAPEGTPFAGGDSTRTQAQVDTGADAGSVAPPPVEPNVPFATDSPFGGADASGDDFFSSLGQGQDGEDAGTVPPAPPSHSHSPAATEAAAVTPAREATPETAPTAASAPVQEQQQDYSAEWAAYYASMGYDMSQQPQGDATRAEHDATQQPAAQQEQQQLQQPEYTPEWIAYYKSQGYDMSAYEQQPAAAPAAVPEAPAYAQGSTAPAPQLFTPGPPAPAAPAPQPTSQAAGPTVSMFTPTAPASTPAVFQPVPSSPATVPAVASSPAPHVQAPPMQPMHPMHPMQPVQQPTQPVQPMQQPYQPYQPPAQHQPFNLAGSGVAYAPSADGRQRDGRPPCVAVRFGFGGKLVTVAPTTYGSGAMVRVHSVHTLLRAAPAGGPGATYIASLERTPTSASASSASGFVSALKSSGSSSSLAKYASERADRVAEEQLYGENTRLDGMQTLWGVLKVLAEHRGVLADKDATGGNSTGPAAALAAVLSPGAGSDAQGGWVNAGGRAAPLRVGVDTQAQQAASVEMERLLLGGRRADALAVAVGAGLWGPAMLLSRQCGEKHFQETAAAMARACFVPGSPIRTLQLLQAGLDGEVFGAAGQAGAAVGEPGQLGISDGADASASTLTQWRENLTIMAANRTPGDGRVIAELGDRLWGERGEMEAAHACYVIAQLQLQPYAPHNRLCLVGADHRARPRTFATPAAIQRTEILEHCVMQANPQAVLGAFQPYKLVLAGALAEAGMCKEALGYVESALKALRALDRASGELNAKLCASTALELQDRLQGALQKGAWRGGSAGGGSLLSGLGRVLDKGITSLFGDDRPAEQQPPSGQQQQPMANGDYGASRPPLPPGGGAAYNQQRPETMQRTSSAPTMNSEPASTPSDQGEQPAKPSPGSGGGGVAKTLGGLFSRVIPRRKNANEAKLGLENDFYYDEVRKTWVIKGEEPPEAQAAHAPPPTFGGGGASPFGTPGASPAQPSGQGGAAAAVTPPSMPGMGGPPAASPSPLGGPPGGPPAPPPGGNAFSARARGGSVRSRYVDTMNPGAASSPVAPAAGAPGAGLMPPSAPGRMPPGPPGRAGPKPGMMFVPAAPMVPAAPASDDGAGAAPAPGMFVPGPPPPEAGAGDEAAVAQGAPPQQEAPAAVPPPPAPAPEMFVPGPPPPAPGDVAADGGAFGSGYNLLSGSGLGSGAGPGGSDVVYGDGGPPSGGGYGYDYSQGGAPVDCGGSTPPLPPPPAFPADEPPPEAPAQGDAADAGGDSEFADLAL